MSKYKQYEGEIKDLFKSEKISQRAIVRKIAKKYNLNENGLRKHIRRKNILNSIVDETMHRNNLPDNWSCAWVKDKDTNVSVLVKNPNNEESTYEDFREDFLNEMKRYSPKYKKLKRSEYKDPHLLVIDIADLHIGKLSSSTESEERSLKPI